MQPTADIRRLASLLGRRLDDPVVKRLLNQCGEAPPKVTEENSGCRFDRLGMELLLSHEDSIALSKKSRGKSPWRITAIKFYSDLYRRRIDSSVVEYAGPLPGGVSFRDSPDDVQEALGAPVRSSRAGSRFDEYDFTDGSVQFVYPKDLSSIFSVGLLLPPALRRELGWGVAGETPAPAQPVRTASGSSRGNASESTASTGMEAARLRCYTALFARVHRSFPSPPRKKRAIGVLAFHTAKLLPAKYTLVTSGMSDHRMKMPPDAAKDNSARVELIWHVPKVRASDVEWLRFLAEYPFIEKTWLGHGDTIVGGTVFGLKTKNEDLSHVLFLYSRYASIRDVLSDARFGKDKLRMLWVVPITDEELKLNQEAGLKALLERFDACALPLEFDEARGSCVE